MCYVNELHVNKGNIFTFTLLVQDNTIFYRTVYNLIICYFTQTVHVRFLLLYEVCNFLGILEMSQNVPIMNPAKRHLNILENTFFLLP